MLSPQQATDVAIVALLGAAGTLRKCEATRFTTNETNQTLSPESLRARRQRLVPTRCYGSGRRALPHHPASLARAARASQPTKQRSQRGPPRRAPITPKLKMDNIMYLYEQLGPPDAPTRPRRRRGKGDLGGLNWVALERRSTPRGRRARPRRRDAGRRTPRFAARDCGGRS